MQLAGQIAVVTGGAHGIGRALCRRFAAEGAASIVVADCNLAAAEQVAAEINGVAVECDVSQEAAVQSLVNQTLSQHGRIDLFASNAGVTVKGGVEVPDPQWQWLWDVNLMAHVYAARAVLPSMIERGHGYLLQTSSAAGLLTEIGSAAYAVTKHAAVGLAEWLAVRYRKQGIRVSCLCPAGVATDFLDLDDPVHQFLHMSAVTPEELMDNVIAGLASEKFLIVSHPEVEEFFQFKSSRYDDFLRNFSKVHDKIERSRNQPSRPPRERDGV